MEHVDPLTLSPGMAPAAPLMRLLASFDREKVEAFAEISIALLDLIDGDPDDGQTNDAEDDFAFSETALGNAELGPGCIASDPAEDDDPAEESGDEYDLSWPEWHTRGRRKVTAGGYEMTGIGGRHGIPSTMPTDDDEDDDPLEEDDHSGQCDEDGINYRAQGLEYGEHAGPGCRISDEGIADMGGFHD